MDPVLLTLGGAVAKSVLSLWLGNTAVLGDLSNVGVDLLIGKIPNLGIIERRRAIRQFDQMQEAVAEKLEPFLRVEFNGLPENERSAAVIAVANGIERAGVTTELLLAQDLDPLRLEQHVRAHASKERELLSEAATYLYDHLLREACNYTIEVAVTLPPFASQATRESLRRETEMIDLIRTVLSKIPDPAIARRVGEEADASFDTQYRRTIARLLDRLELFGLDVSPLSKRYSLSVAYITLSVMGSETADKEDAESVRVTQALAGSQLLLVRGDAGSGKTTLLQWLAVTSARQSFDSEMEDWNNTVPFFIRLRSHVDNRLPPPEEFLDDVTPNLTGAMPAGWVHRQLESGRALVLVDGVDELPDDERRQQARDWLRDLAATFPTCRFVATSRPTATDEDWLADASFRSCMLQPMTLADADSFITHWHDAIRAALPDPDDQAQLDRLGAALKATIRARPTIRSLATSPLLCAMLCALHRDRSEELPEDRMELYRVALEVLLERRDVERRVREARRLPMREKQLLLRDLAYWLVLNNYVDADEVTVIERIDQKLASMPRIDDSAATIFQYLKERSGVLRSPVEGRIDFVHRTFQEYFAAQEAVEQEHIGLLIENAHRDAWREMIVLAAGHATGRQRERLLRGLLERGNQDIEHRHPLHLLAVACLETSPEVPADLTDELRQVLSSLLPPKNMTEAQAVASAGQLAVPLLAQVGYLRAREAAACVRALALIGGADALDAIASYGHDGRRTVKEEVRRAWDTFDPIEFAQRVLAQANFEDALAVSNLSLIPAIRYLKQLASLRLEIGISASDLETIREVGSLVSFMAADIEHVTDLSPFSELHLLEDLELWQASAITNLDPLRELHLERLGLYQAEAIEDIAALSNMSSLRYLSITESPLSDLSPLAGVQSLVEVNLSGCIGIQDLSTLPGDNLSRLILQRCDGIRDLSSLRSLTKLEDLDVSGCTALEDISGLSALPSLQVVDMAGCASVQDFSALKALEQLRTLDLQDCAVHELSFLGSNLEWLSLQMCPIDDLSALSRLQGLQHLNILGCRNITDLTPLESLEDLHVLDLNGIGVGELSPLGNFRAQSLRVFVDYDIWFEVTESIRASHEGYPPTYSTARIEMITSHETSIEIFPGPYWYHRGV
jgi:hypothetical protein